MNYQSLEDGLAVMEELSFALTGKWQRTVSDAAAFTQVIAAVNTSSRDDVTIILNGSFAAESVMFTGGAAKTIALRGEGANRTITNSGDAEIFTVPAGITLVLDNNLVLDSNKKKAWLVNVMGGTLVMKDGSTLRRSGSVGVYIGNGNFTMSGGTISRNTASGYGGGVYVSSIGYFGKIGGTIDATNSARYGRVAYVMSGNKKRDSAAGPGVTLDSRIPGQPWE
ncbi:MAG: hypothetical protein LBG05_02350 [Treponema sp.]|nr:hypothetical protein [Treponema sp.]